MLEEQYREMLSGMEKDACEVYNKFQVEAKSNPKPFLRTLTEVLCDPKYIDMPRDLVSLVCSYEGMLLNQHIHVARFGHSVFLFQREGWELLSQAGGF